MEKETSVQSLLYEEMNALDPKREERKVMRKKAS